MYIYIYSYMFFKVQKSLTHKIQRRHTSKCPAPKHLIYIYKYIQKHIIFSLPGLVSTHLDPVGPRETFGSHRTWGSRAMVTRSWWWTLRGVKWTNQGPVGWGSLGVRSGCVCSMMFVDFVWKGERFFEKDMWYVYMICPIYHVQVVLGFRWVRFGNVGRLFSWVERHGLRL